MGCRVIVSKRGECEVEKVTLVVTERVVEIVEEERQVRSIVSKRCATKSYTSINLVSFS